MNHNYRSSFLRTGALAMVLMLLTHDALAWGPRSKSAIAAAAVTQIRRDASEMFLSGGRQFENDLIRGAEEGMDLLAEFNSFETEDEAIDTIMNEIILLRSVRQRGVGGYFAYRLGALGSLVAQVMTPYGFADSPKGREIYARLSADVEKHVQDYSFDPNARRIGLIENPERFFSNKRPFWSDDLDLIREQYDLGSGYGGYLEGAAPAFFQRAAEAVASAWRTVMADDIVGSRPAHASALTEYYIDEIRYQLQVKDNVAAADRAYRDFVAVTDGDTAHYIAVGDLYYDFGTEESIERAVHEWKVAHRTPGPQARIASRRLANHYVSDGEELFARSMTPEALDSDLEDALRSFETALSFDGTSQRAAELVSQTSNAIVERRELYDEQQLFLDNAAVIMENADRSLFEKDYADSLSSYQQALTLAERVGPEFVDLQEQATDMASDLRKAIKSTISEIFAVANEKIVEGDQLADALEFDQSLNVYRSVESILADIPAEEGSIEAERRSELEDIIAGKVQEVEIRINASQAAQQNRNRR